MTRSTTIIPATFYAAALLAVAGFWGTASACMGCIGRPTAFENITRLSETIRLGGAPARAYYERGKELYSVAGQYEGLGLPSSKEVYNRAITDLNEAVRLSAESEWPHDRKSCFKMRGTIHFSAGNYALAIADYSEAIRLNPRDAVDSRSRYTGTLNDGLYFARGAAHYITGAYDKAVKDFESARRTRVADEEFLAEAAIKFAKKRLAGGAAPGDSAAEAEREYFKGLVYYIFYDDKVEHFGKRHFRAARMLDPENAEYRFMSGMSDKPFLDGDSVMRHLDEAIRLAPNEARYYAARARVRLNSVFFQCHFGDCDDREARRLERHSDTDYKNAIRLAPRVPEYRIESAASLADYIKAVQLDSGIIYRIEALRWRDHSRNRRLPGDPGLGGVAFSVDCELLKKLKRLYPGAPSYNKNIACESFYPYFEEEPRPKPKPEPDTEAHYYSKAKNYYPFWGEEKADSIIVRYTKLIKRYTRNAPYYAMRAVAYDEKGDSAKAVADFVKAVEIDSAFMGWEWFRLSWMGLGGPRKSFFIDLYTELIRKSPSKAEYYYQRGLMGYLLGRDYDNAINDFCNAARLKPNEAAYHKARGDAHLRKGEREKAIASHLEAARLDPNGILMLLKEGLNDGGLPIRDYRTEFEKAKAKGEPMQIEPCPKMYEFPRER